jgi:O-antigen chain-terminating methyltransferase
MSETLPPRPAPIPPPDRHQIERLNTIYDLSAAPASRRWHHVLTSPIQWLFGRLLSRQREFNAVLVDHINRNDLVGIEAHHSSVRAMQWIQETVLQALDEVRRHQHALAAWERRSDRAVASMAAQHEELRVSLGVLQQATQNLKRELARVADTGIAAPRSDGTSGPAPAVAADAALESHKYVGFEDQFRGSSADIRGRVAEYLPVFRGAQDVLDVGCGRGEFLALLKEAGVKARGIDVNSAMVDVCRQHGLDATESDALTYLRAQPDGSLGGLFAAQVIEHLEPRYLAGLLDAAFDKLRPGAPIVLETINPACWFAFFESYIRDITHVRAIHPDTLKYLLIANGFQHVEIRYRAPYPEHEKLQPIEARASLGDAVDTLNANVERINRLLFTWLDYAAIGTRP